MKKIIRSFSQEVFDRNAIFLGCNDRVKEAWPVVTEENR